MRRSKALVIFLLLVLVVSFAACSKISDKVAEKGVEKLIESQTGGKVNISEGGSKIEVNGQSIEAGDKLDWPKDAMGDLPKPKAKVTFVMNAGEGKGCSVSIEEFAKDDAKNYVENLKGMGYKELLNMQNEEGFSFAGETEKATVNFDYNLDSKDGSITYSLKEKEE